MTRTRALSSAALALAALYALDLAILRSRLFADAPEAIALGVSLDLTVTAVFLVWVFAVRLGHVPGIVLAPVFLAGLYAASTVIPAGNRQALHALAALWALAELGLVVVGVVRLRRLATEVRARRRAGSGLFEALEGGFLTVTRSPFAARALAAEAGAVAYAFGGWFRRAPAPGPDRYSLGRARPYATLLGTLGFLVIVEVFALHLLVTRWSAVAAWVLTGTSAYALLWLVGEIQALRLEPLRLVDDALVLTVGVRWRARLPYAAIAGVTPAGDAGVDRETLDVSFLGADLLVTLHEPAVALGPLGIRRSFRKILLSVERPDELATELRKRLPGEAADRAARPRSAGA